MGYFDNVPRMVPTDKLGRWAQLMVCQLKRESIAAAMDGDTFKRQEIESLIDEFTVRGLDTVEFVDRSVNLLAQFEEM